jgi:hypothetical protein
VTTVSCSVIFSLNSILSRNTVCRVCEYCCFLCAVVRSRASEGLMGFRSHGVVTRGGRELGRVAIGHIVMLRDEHIAW